VDTLVRKALAAAGVDFRVVYGQGRERLENAAAAIESLARSAPGASWKWTCEKCSDPDCEWRLFTSLTGRDHPPY